MGGGGGVATPQVDPAQEALEQQQTQMLQQQQAILTQQQSDDKVIAPFLYQSMGLTPSYDANGNLTGLAQNPQVVANQNQQNTVNGLLLNQEQQALTGTLPVNPLVGQQIQKNNQQLKDTLGANLGPGYAASTPGQTAQNNADVTNAGIIQGANTGQLSLDQQLAALGQSNSSNMLSSEMQGVAGTNSLGFSLAGAYGNAVQSAGIAQQPFEQQSSNQLQAESLNANLQAQSSAGTGQLIGGVVGAGLSAAAIIFV